MNDILTPKEWLEKEYGYTISALLGTSDVDKPFNHISATKVMELYANYRNRMLEAKILEFRGYIKTADERIILPIELEYLIKKYDKHFNITIERQGKIN